MFSSFRTTQAMVFGTLVGFVGLPVASSAVDEWNIILGNYCLECHDSLSEKGGVDIEFLLDEDFASYREQWEQVLRQVNARHMPPVGEDRPEDGEYERVVAQLIEKLDALAVKDPDPGRTDTVRRLTRTEYQNSVRDLLALEVDVSELLPADESSHGFDNVTVGELSPVLLDRYISAARKISREAIGGSDSLSEHTVRIKPDISQEDHVEGLPLGTRGGALIAHHFPRTGQYEIQVRLTRDRNEMIEGLNRTHQMEMLVDGAPMATVEVKPPKNRKDHTKADANLSARFYVAAGPRQLGVTFRKDREVIPETLRQPYEANFNFHRHPRLSPAIFQVSIVGPFAAEEMGPTPSREKIFSAPRGADISGEAYGKTLVEPLLRQAWRRPVTSDDVDRILPFFVAALEESGSIDSAMEAALSAILVSREFLFKIEKEPEDIEPGTAYSLSDLELATRLSYFLWSSLPDEELLDLAAKGELSEPATLDSQARRMLADERSQSLVTNFADQWLHLRNLDSITPDGRLFPGFDDNLRQAFRRETEWLFETVMREDRSVLDLLQSDETLLNERLAKHYGIPHVYGTRYRTVSLPEHSQRGGLLRHGSVLTVTSYATRTSPVIRGNWILENILGTPPPPPPPNVPALEETSVAESLPIRERLAEHRKNKGCASCHNVMDPVGFALENFDAVGRWRILDQGLPVDATGGMADGREFEGVEGLEAAILDRPEFFVSALTEKLMIYGLGRGVDGGDAPTIRRIVRETEKDSYRFSDLVSAIVRSEAFTMRLSGDPSAAANREKAAH